MQTIECPQCGSEQAAGQLICANCRADLPIQGDATGGLIPYKNPKALLAYYLGIASGLPLIGLPLGVAALVLGILGLKDRRENPAIRGSVHAGVGIGCGLFFTLFWTLVIVAVALAAFSKNL